MLAAEYPHFRSKYLLCWLSDRIPNAVLNLAFATPGFVPFTNSNFFLRKSLP